MSLFIWCIVKDLQESVVLEKGEWVQNWYVICDIFEIMKSKNI